MHKIVWYAGSMLIPLVAQSTWIDSFLGLGTTPSLRTALSFLLTMVQVGQAAAFQVLLTRPGKQRFSRRVAAVILVAAIIQFILLTVCWRGSSLGAAISLATSGMAIGASFSVLNAHYLAIDAKTYFRKLFLRNLTFVALFFVVIHVFENDGLIALCEVACAVAAVTAVRSCAWRTLQQSGRGSLAGRDYVLIALGAAAACLYRNDQNLVRASVESSRSFSEFHDMLLLGAALQACFGALLTTAALPRFCAGEVSEGAIRSIGAILAGVIAITAVLACFAAVTSGPIAVLIASAMLALNQWWAVQMHVSGRSVYVYATGALAFMLLCFMLRIGTAPAIAYVGYAIVTVLSLMILANRSRDEQAKQV